MNSALQREITLPSVLKFTLPSIIMMVVMSLYTVVDGMFVSRLIGTDAFSAVNIVYPLGSILIGLGTMLGAGITAIVSTQLGEGRQKTANQNFTFIIIFAVILGMVLTIVCLFFLDDIIFLLGSNEEIFHYCKAYALPLALFTTANILQFPFQNLYVANGKPAIGLILTTIGGVTNIVLDYVFIAILDMGIAGAAVATGIGYSIPAIFGLIYFSLNRKGPLHFVKPKVNWSVLLYTMGNGSSEMVNYLSTSVTTLLFNIIMMKFAGQNGVAAIAILLYLDFILIAVNLGYSMGAAPLFSYNYGCGDREKLRKLFRLSSTFCILTGIIMTIGTLLFVRPLTTIFAVPDSDVFTLAAAGLKIYAFSYLFKGVSIFSSAMFTAFGNGRVSALLSLLRTFVFLTASLLGLSALFGITGVWYATPLAEFLAFAVSLFFIWRYRSTYHLFS